MAPQLSQRVEPVFEQLDRAVFLLDHQPRPDLLLAPQLAPLVLVVQYFLPFYYFSARL